MSKINAKKHNEAAVAQNGFEYGMTKLVEAFTLPGEVITREGQHLTDENIALYVRNSMASTIVWKLENLVKAQAERHDQLTRIAKAKMRDFDGTEIATEELRRIKLDLDNSESVQLLLDEHLLSAKGTYEELVGRPYGKPSRTVRSDAIGELERMLGTKATRRETVGTGEA